MLQNFLDACLSVEIQIFGGRVAKKGIDSETTTYILHKTTINESKSTS
jgi:hypothetical protein